MSAGAKAPIAVSFVYHLEADPTFWAEPKAVELRAEVTFSGRDLDQADVLLPYTEPVVVPLDKAVWQDALGNEILFGARSEHWVGAEEAAIEAAVETLSQQATRESNAMARAS